MAKTKRKKSSDTLIFKKNKDWKELPGFEVRHNRILFGVIYFLEDEPDPVFDPVSSFDGLVSLEEMRLYPQILAKMEELKAMFVPR